MGKKTDTLHIGIYAGNERSVKAMRDKISGCLRYAGGRDDWEVRLLDAASARSCRARRSDPPLDGVILLSRSPDAPSLRRVPHAVRVDVAPDARNTPVIAIDDAAIGEAGVDFFVRRGFRALAFVGSESRTSSLDVHSRAREASFRAAARRQHLGFAVHRVASDADEGWSQSLARLSKFVAQLPKPCGIMACADETGKMVLDACRLAHVRVPDQVSILGVDNETDICENMQPTLSSILPDFERCGFLAARLLDRHLQYGRTCRPRVHAYGVARLVERASTLDLRGGGRIVSAATDIIRRKALSGLRVHDVAAELRVSPRLLELRFREIKDHSVQDEIVALRLGEAQRLVRHSRLPLSEIAARCGWQSPTALQVLFRRHFGRSMTAYRTA